MRPGLLEHQGGIRVVVAYRDDRLASAMSDNVNLSRMVDEIHPERMLNYR